MKIREKLSNRTKIVSFSLAVLMVFGVMAAVLVNRQDVVKANAAGSYDPNKAAEYAKAHYNCKGACLQGGPTHTYYSGGDCANFVSQCLSYAGLTENSKWKLGTTAWNKSWGLRDYLSDLGATIIENPSFNQIEVGDVLATTWTSCTNGKMDYGHVVICVDIKNGVPWICGHTDHYYGNCSYLKDKKFAVIKMKNLTSSIPTSPSISINKNEFILGETVSFSFSGNNSPTFYIIGIDKDGTRVVTNESTTSSYTISTLQPGNYSAYVTVGNNEGSSDSERVYFTVRGDVTSASISINKNEFILGETVSFLFSGNNSPTYYIIGIDKDDTRIITKEVGSSYDISTLQPGNYSAYVTVGNNEGSSNSEKVYFTVRGDVTSASININKNEFILGETVSFSFSGNNSPTFYIIGIDKDDTRIITEEVGSSYDISTLQPGNYSAYVTVGNNEGSSNSEKVYFTVTSTSIPATSISFGSTSMTMKVGDTFFLLAAYTPANTTDTVEWTSSNPSVATVSDGRVTAVASGMAVITATAGSVSATCTVTVEAAAPVTYDVKPNINGGASKLYEPWGLRYYAVYDGTDSDKIADRGIAILKDTYYQAGMTPAAFCANEKVHIFLDSRKELDFEEQTSKYPNGRYFATLTEGIYSYDISANYYVVPFAVIDNGQTIYGSIKKNSMENILKSNLNLTSITDSEKAVCTCILELKDSVAAHYAASGVPGASTDKVIPRGSSQSAATVKTISQSGVTPNIVGGASRLIEPWGLRYFATYTDSTNIAERGVVMLCETYYNTSYSTSPDQMRLNANAYVFRESDGTLEKEIGTVRYFATLTEGISSKDISDVYYVVPFVVLKDGSYVYGTVKSNSMMKIMNANLKSSSVSATERAVSQDIIDLYNAVKVYNTERAANTNP